MMPRFGRSTLATALAAALLAVAGAALAQTTAPAPAPPPTPPAAAAAGAASTKGAGGGGGALAACRADLATLCSGVQPGGGKKAQCLVENRAKASPGCQAALASVADKRQAQGERKARPGKALAACETDLATFCAGSTEKPAKCLKINEAKLSPACGIALKAMTDVRQRVMAACQGDMPTLCQASSKPGEVMKCLRTNQAKLSPACATVIAELPQRRK
jgi:hypothetical protein